jgi:SAM-dependent methyltransferase
MDESTLPAATQARVAAGTATTAARSRSGRRKKRNLNSIIREALLTRRYRASFCQHAFDYDWSTIRHNRISLVNRLVADNPGGDYLEIGCASNLLFDAVMAARKTGVDPQSGGTHRLTSDEFFRAHPEARFDVVFIDGLHHYDQIHRDVANALRATRAGGWIGLHDMLPRDWIEEHVPQISTSRWTGDGWKVAFELIASPDVDFRLLAIDHGVGVVRVLKDGATLADRARELGAKRFSYLYEHFAELPIVDYDVGRAWIDSYRT